MHGQQNVKSLAHVKRWMNFIVLNEWWTGRSKSQLLSNMLIWLDGRESYYVQEVAGSWPVFRPDTLGMGVRWFVTPFNAFSLWWLKFGDDLCLVF